MEAGGGPGAVRQGAGAFGLRTALYGAALLLVAVPFGLLLLLVQDRWTPLLRLDEGARDAAYGWATGSPGLVTVMEAVSTLGTSGAYLVVYGLLVVLLLRRRLHRAAAFVAVTVVGGGLLNVAVKAAVDRARPVLPDPVSTAAHSSFPSGHAQGVVVACGVLLLVLLPVVPAARRRLAVLAAAGWVLLMGASRVVLGVHYVSDVVAGYLLGLAWLAVCAAAFQAWTLDAGGRRSRAADGLEPEAAGRLRGL